MPNPIKPLTANDHMIAITDQFVDTLFSTKITGQLNRMSVADSRKLAIETVHKLLFLRAHVTNTQIEKIDDITQDDVLILSQSPEVQAAVKTLTAALQAQGNSDEKIHEALETLHQLNSKKYFTDAEEAIFDYEQVIHPLMEQAREGREWTNSLPVPALQMISHYIENLRLSITNFVGDEIVCLLPNFKGKNHEDLTKEVREQLFNGFVGHLEEFLQQQEYTERLTAYNKDLLEARREADAIRLAKEAEEVRRKPEATPEARSFDLD